VLISIQNEREWVTFCTTFLDAPDLPKQPGFESNNIRVAIARWWMTASDKTFAALTATKRQRNYERRTRLWFCQRSGSPESPPGATAHPVALPAAASRRSSPPPSSASANRSTWAPSRQLS